ncbi:alpha-ketoacid dehydrogenase subunit beta [Rathayibacter toxicus]|nr:alpha-ketoacid dehydrogenase subunit beta [Rathayibacter toxicus]
MMAASSGAVPVLTQTSLVGALNLALRHEMANDPRVLVFGEDVGKLGGVFRVTDGLQAEFGESRCFDTPIAEAGILGAAIGMAMHGYRPVVEMQFDAYGYPAFEQMVSHLAKLRNRTRGKVSMPVVVRIPYGGGVGAAEHHNDSSEAYATHTPGLHVYTPSNVADAYHLLRQAVRSDDPVIFYEPKRLYWETDELNVFELPEEAGRAVVRRAGGDLTLITYGPATVAALAAAEAAEIDGYDVGVVDLRTLVPFDEDTVCEEIMSTGRALVVHEAAQFQGFGAEIVARLTERCFAYLEGPIRRVAGLDIPYPPPLLEQYYLPTTHRILQAIGDHYSEPN